ncbi:MAG: glycosyl hydrolase family 57, partial [Puniceicoccales bacterium]
MPKTASVFTTITDTETPGLLEADAESRRAPAFKLSFTADGVAPFAQIIVRGPTGETVFSGDDISENKKKKTYTAKVTAESFGPGRYEVQFEGCQQADWRSASGDQWIKAFGHFEVSTPPRAKVFQGDSSAVKIYYGIHKHMHQPYYDAANPDYWDGEKGSIFGSRHGAYSSFIPMAVRHYMNGGLPHAGLSTSWSGSLIEQLNGKGGFPGWSDQLREIAQAKTALGNPRCDFTAFGFFHPLMALTPSRNIVKQIEWHRGIIRSQFGVEASDVLFPPETAFHVRMIPALVEAGVKAVIYDSIHRFRASKEYP